MRVRFHRGAAALLAVMTALPLAACSAGPSQAKGTPRVAFVVPARLLSFSREMGDGFMAGVNEVGGVDASVTGPDIVDGPQQIKLFNAAVGSAKGGMSIFTISPDLFVGPLTAAAKHGIPLIAVDNPPPLAAGVGLFIGNDNTAMGALLADLVIAKLPAGAKGTVILGTTSPGAPVLDRRADGMRSEFARKLPGVRVFGPFDTKQEPSANLAAWGTLVKANPGALAFMGTGDADGWNLAAIKVRTHAKWVPAAFDLDPKALKAVKAGNLLLVSPEHFMKGAIAGRLQASHAKDGTKLPKGWVYVPGLAVTPANIDAVIARQTSTATKEAALKGQIEDILSHLNQRMRPLDKAS